jgi:hypothetical protein
MSFLTSKFNLCVFELPEGFKISQGEAFKKIHEFKFKEGDSSKDFAHGFSNPEDLFKDFTVEDSFVVNSLICGYRFDKKKVPAPLLKKFYKEKLKEKSGEYGVKLTKQDKKMLKEECKAQLLLKTLPTPTLLNWIWDTDNNVIYFDSKSKMVIDRFKDLFYSAFEVPLTQKNFELTEEDIPEFLEHIWKTAENEENENYWINQEVTLDSEKNTFKFNGPSIEEFLEEIDSFKKSKKIKNINIGVSLNKSDYSLSFNSKNMIVSVESLEKIKHESVETAVLDNMDRISTIVNHLEDLVKNYLN